MTERSRNIVQKQSLAISALALVETIDTAALLVGTELGLWCARENGMVALDCLNNVAACFEEGTERFGDLESPSTPSQRSGQGYLRLWQRTVRQPCCI